MREITKTCKLYYFEELPAHSKKKALKLEHIPTNLKYVLDDVCDDLREIFCNNIQDSESHVTYVIKSEYFVDVNIRTNGDGIDATKNDRLKNCLESNVKANSNVCIGYYNTPIDYIDYDRVLKNVNLKLYIDSFNGRTTHLGTYLNRYFILEGDNKLMKINDCISDYKQSLLESIDRLEFYEDGTLYIEE